MPVNKAQTHKQHHNGKTQFVYKPRQTALSEPPQDPGVKSEPQPVGSKIPFFLRDSFTQKDWNR